MQDAFLVHGYGIPKNIEKDENYRTYLNVAFNTIYDASVRDGVDPVIVFSGGKTDIFKPYTRTEAGEMARYFKQLAKRSVVQKQTAKWEYVLESRSLSTLENLLNTRAILDKKYPKIKNITLIFEQSRMNRIHELAKRVFAGFDELTLVPIDFDVSSNRYDLRLIDEKEAEALKWSLWSLQSLEHLKAHHDVFAEKVRLLRKAGPNKHQEAIRAWWKFAIERMKELEAQQKNG